MYNNRSSFLIVFFFFLFSFFQILLSSVTKFYPFSFQVRALKEFFDMLSSVSCFTCCFSLQCCYVSFMSLTRIQVQVDFIKFLLVLRYVFVSIVINGRFITDLKLERCFDFQEWDKPPSFFVVFVSQSWIVCFLFPTLLLTFLCDSSTKVLGFSSPGFYFLALLL